MIMLGKILKLMSAVMSALCFVSCDNEGDLNNCNSGIRWFVDPDTTVSGSAHTFVVELSDAGQGLPDDWDFNLLSVDDFARPEGGSWCLINDYLTYGKDEMSISWVKVEKVKGDGCPAIKISLTENEGDIRAVRIGICKQHSKNGYFLSEYFVTQKGQSDTAPYEVKIRYKKQVYSTIAHTDEEGYAVYEDSLFKEKLEELSQREDIEAFVMGDDGIVDYFDSDDFASQPALKRMMQPIPDSEIVNVYPVGTTRGYSSMFAHCDDTALGFVEMFDDNNFKDTSIYQNLYEPLKCFDVVKMEDRGLNDKISSLVLTYQGDDPDICAVLTVWEDAFFNKGDNDRTKHKINFVASYKNRMAFSVNLKSVPCMNSSNTWNDRISSCSFHFGYYGLYPKEY